MATVTFDHVAEYFSRIHVRVTMYRRILSADMTGDIMPVDINTKPALCL